MTRHSGLIVSLALGLAVAGCTSTPAAKTATFTEADCPEDVTSVVVGELTCGFLTVPEDRSDPERTVRIFVARIVPPQRVHDDPMLVVGADLAGLPNYGGVAPLAQRVGREVIIIDARGVGHSQPSLACQEVDELRTSVLATATDDPATRAMYLDAIAACHDRLSRDGVDVSAYNLTEMAADAEDLRIALDIQKWNVVTYGTASRIALEMLRSKPGTMRSLLLDSPEVPNTDPRAIAATSTRVQVDAVLASCAADQACSTAFPNAPSSLDTAMAALAARPVTVSMGEPTGTGVIPVLYDDAMLLRTLRAMLSDGGSSGPIMVPQAIPAFLAHVNAGRLAELGPTLAPVVARAQPYCIGYQPKCLPQHKMSVGVLYSVLCHDIAPFHDAEVPTWTATRAFGTSPAFATSPYLNVCEKWPIARKAAAEVAKPPTSDVPTLVATGAFAPYAPEGVLRKGLSGLSNVAFAIDSGNGHNVIVSTDCLAAARNKWLDELHLAPIDLACMHDQTAHFVTDLATVLGTTAPPGTENASLEGAWLASLTRAEIAAALAAGGFSDLSDRFFRVEEIPLDGVRFLLKIEAGRFSGVYNNGLDEKGEWYVGWSGTIAVHGDQIELKDPKEGTTEILRFAVTADQLELTPLTATPATLKGLPTLAFDYAYLAAKPLARVDCASVTPPCT